MLVAGAAAKFASDDGVESDEAADELSEDAVDELSAGVVDELASEVAAGAVLASGKAIGSSPCSISSRL